jgi:hypothetical protein
MITMVSQSQCTRFFMASLKNEQAAVTTKTPAS